MLALGAGALDHCAFDVAGCVCARPMNQASLRQGDLELEHVLAVVRPPLGLAFADHHAAAHRLDSQSASGTHFAAVAPAAAKRPQKDPCRGSLRVDSPWAARNTTRSGNVKRYSRRRPRVGDTKPASISPHTMERERPSSLPTSRSE
jgi:hypothetical protein